MSGVFYVFKCQCLKWSVQEVRVSLDKGHFKCKYCGKTSKIIREGESSPAMMSKGPFDKPREATHYCIQLNGARL